MNYEEKERNHQLLAHGAGRLAHGATRDQIFSTKPSDFGALRRKAGARRQRATLVYKLDFSVTIRITECYGEK
jgi:hypothetical protein